MSEIVFKNGTRIELSSSVEGSERGKNIEGLFMLPLEPKKYLIQIEIGYFQRKTPNFNDLSPSTKQEIINNFIESFSQFLQNGNLSQGFILDFFNSIDEEKSCFRIFELKDNSQFVFELVGSFSNQNTTQSRYWECECCGSLIVTKIQDDAADYPCPQCTIVKCEHGGKYAEISIEKFCKEADIANPSLLYH